MLSVAALVSLALQLPNAPLIGRSVRHAPVISMKTPADIGEAKVAFQNAYGRNNIPSQPVQSFINSMLTQQFALVAPTYRYSRIYAVGFETLCTAFLEGTARDAKDGEEVRTSLYVGLGMDAAECKADADALLALAAGKTEEELLASDDFQQVKAAPFKYSLQFGSGLVALMKVVDVKPSAESIQRWCDALDLPNAASCTRDFEYFETQMRKLETFQEMLLQMKGASKRREAEQLKAKAAKAAEEASAAEAAAATE